MKRFAPDKVNTRALISKVKQGFKIVLKRPALRNLILVMLASLRTTTFRINTLAAHLPVLVAHYKTKQNLTSSLIHIFRFPIVRGEVRVSPVLIFSHKISKKPYVQSLPKKLGANQTPF